MLSELPVRQDFGGRKGLQRSIEVDAFTNNVERPVRNLRVNITDIQCNQANRGQHEANQECISDDDKRQGGKHLLVDEIARNEHPDTQHQAEQCDDQA